MYATATYEFCLTDPMCGGVHKGCVRQMTYCPAIRETDMPADGFVPGNRLLAALPPEVLERLAPEMETVSIR